MNTSNLNVVAKAIFAVVTVTLVLFGLSCRQQPGHSPLVPQAHSQSVTNP